MTLESSGQAATIADSLTAAENWTDRPLVDRTELQGLFADLSTLFGVFDRLGLKLEPQKAAAATFVVEHVERPAEN